MRASTIALPRRLAKTHRIIADSCGDRRQRPIVADEHRVLQQRIARVLDAAIARGDIGQVQERLGRYRQFGDGQP